LGFCFILIINTIVSGSYLILAKNPIYSLLCLITVIFNTIILLLTLKIEFLALTFLIIYLGAIAILFLFVIMMFNLKKLQTSVMQNNWGYSFIFYIFTIPHFYILICTYIRKYFTAITDEILYVKTLQPSVSMQSDMHDLFFILKYKNNDIFIFSDLFYNYYNILFLTIGIVLLTAMLGSIILALSTIED